MSADHPQFEKWTVQLSGTDPAAPFSYVDDTATAAKVALGCSIAIVGSTKQCCRRRFSSKQFRFTSKWKETG